MKKHEIQHLIRKSFIVKSLGDKYSLQLNHMFFSYDQSYCSHYLELAKLGFDIVYSIFHSGNKYY